MRDSGTSGTPLLRDGSLVFANLSACVSASLIFSILLVRSNDRYTTTGDHS